MAANEDEPLDFAHQAAWAQWLSLHHGDSGGVWVRHAKKGAPHECVSHDEALEVALCFGWIDGQRKSLGQHHWLQRWVPRGARSIWSKINRGKALRYIEEGKMQPSGLKEIERAKADGRWDAAYDAASTAQVPADLRAAFDAHPGAAEFFATISAQNRYAVLFRIQTAKKAETRAKKIEQYAQMLARGETLHPQREPKAAAAV
jgi:uncharacterized protein YdeI (YjbR/CyaY-like superfamily)